MSCNNALRTSPWRYVSIETVNINDVMCKTSDQRALCITISYKPDVKVVKILDRLRVYRQPLAL